MTQTIKTKTVWNPKGVAIHFDEAAHRYYTDMVSEFVSVTTFVKHCFPKFDSATNAERVAKREGKTTDAVLAEWSAKAKASSEMGTRVHANQEAIMLGEPPPHLPQSESERLIMASGWEAATDLFDAGFTTVGAEMIVFSENIGLAGTIDLAARDKDGCLWLLDWKTNEEIKRVGFNGATALDPIAHLQDCSLSHYTLQLSTYERILRHEGYIEPGEQVSRALIHLTPEKANIIQVPYLKAEVAEMLLDLKLNSWQVPF